MPAPQVVPVIDPSGSYNTMRLL